MKFPIRPMRRERPAAMGGLYQLKLCVNDSTLGPSVLTVVTETNYLHISSTPQAKVLILCLSAEYLPQPLVGTRHTEPIAS